MTSRTYRRFAWGVLGWNLLVILWGAFVRATGSGAGCGSHWPDCNGEILPRDPGVETMIEFTHRATSGLALLAVLALVFFAWRTFPKGDPTRGAAVGSLVFILIEALLGAGLVLFEFVAGDTRPLRGAVVGLHLVNTLLLLGWLVLVPWHAGGGGRIRLRGQGLVGAALVLALVWCCALGGTGAIAALGDTLFPVESLAEGIQQDLSPGAHLLIRLRVLHPILALLGAFVIGGAAALTASARPHARPAAGALGWLFAIQLGIGLVNLGLLAPIPLQLVHLLAADAVWIALAWLTFQALSEAPERARTEEA